MGVLALNFQPHQWLYEVTYSHVVKEKSDVLDFVGGDTPHPPF